MHTPSYSNCTCVHILRTARLLSASGGRANYDRACVCSLQSKQTRLIFQRWNIARNVIIECTFKRRPNVSFSSFRRRRWKLFIRFSGFFVCAFPSCKLFQFQSLPLFVLRFWTGALCCIVGRWKLTCVQCFVRAYFPFPAVFSNTPAHNCSSFGRLYYVMALVKWA